MPRNRYKYKHTRNVSQSPASLNPAAPGPVAITSPTAQKVMDRIATGGEEYLMKNAERILIDSASLAEEPEFKDLYLNKERTAQVTERWLGKYEARLKAAEKKGEDEFQQVFDDARIKIIDDLATPDFRSKVKDRLRALSNRVLASNDARKIELVMTLGPMLNIKQIPWGVCGLIIAIYERSLKPTLEAVQEHEELVDNVLEMLKEEGEEITDPEELFFNPSSKLDVVGKKLFQKNPGMLDRLKKQADEILDSFEDQVAKGKIPLDLFTAEEIFLPFKRIEEEFGKPITEIPPSEELAKHSAEMVIKTINDLMTPERYQRLRSDLETTAKEWLRQRNKWAMPLQLEVDMLTEEARQDNAFIFDLFYGQLQRAFDQSKAAPQKKKKR